VRHRHERSSGTVLGGPPDCARLGAALTASIVLSQLHSPSAGAAGAHISLDLRAMPARRDGRPRTASSLPPTFDPPGF